MGEVVRFSPARSMPRKGTLPRSVIALIVLNEIRGLLVLAFVIHALLTHH